MSTPTNPAVSGMNAEEFLAFVGSVATSQADRVSAPGTPSHRLASAVNAAGILNGLEARAAHHRVINEALRRSGSGMPVAAEHGQDYCPVCNTSGGCL